VIDDHAHPFPAAFAPLDVDELSLDVRPRPAGHARRRDLAPGRLSTELLVTRLARYLGCDPADAAAARDARAAAGWPQYVPRLMADAGIDGLIMDAAGPLDAELYAAIAGAPVWELVRAEPLIDMLISAGAGAHEVLTGVGEFMSAAAERGVAGFKTVIAYRTGLAVDPEASLPAAERDLAASAPDRDPPGSAPAARRRGKVLRDLVFRRMLGLAADLALPVQVHTGYGDSDLRLAESDPLLLEEVLRTPEGEAATVVLIHGAWPWHDQAAYLASVKPNLYVEMSLSPIFSPVLTADRLLRLLDTAPVGRLLAGTDGHGPPESHWFAAHVLREAFDRAARVLAEAGARPGWLAAARHRMLGENARRVYRLDFTAAATEGPSIPG
jgi:hypothetical protein